MRLVIALGGNAILQRGEAASPEAQRANVARAAAAIAEVARRHDVVVTHGNGPQVGLLALEASAAGHPERSLDVLDAETEGMLGYWIEQALRDPRGSIRSRTIDPREVRGYGAALRYAFPGGPAL